MTKATAALALCLAGTAAASAADLKVLTAGAMKEVVLAAVPQFEAQTGHKVVVANDTAGGLVRRIGSGDAFDLVVITPAALDELAGKGKIVAASRVALARVGVGVVVREGAPKPDISTVEAFRQALRAAKSIAYIDPASGGSSGAYIVKLLDKLGLTAEVAPKTRLKQGGAVATLIASGEAELGLHQISEILPVKGVTLVGPLPAEIQNYTTYAAAVAADAKEPDAARIFIGLLGGAAIDAVLKAKGMARPGS